MTATSMFHVGLLVLDLEEAILDFSKVLNLDFNDPTVVHFNRLEDPDPHEFDVRVTYSRQGPPHLELIEAKGSGVYSAAQGEGFHHIGLWEPNMSKSVERSSTATGLRSEAKIVMPDGQTFVWFSDPASGHGTRLEFVDESTRPDIEKWIRTGEMEGGFSV
ncbi:MAG: hypothetical protein GEV09_06590 [Pseudonocardiaceae bacterium]|nr:hypothetical protein [Pseudonocardiaceae bacterium]